MQTEALDSRGRRIREWLAPVDARANYEQALSARQEGTGQWLLHSEEYQRWKQKSTNVVWLYGNAGCGKSILSATIIEDLSLCQETSKDTVLYFYFDFNDSAKQSWENLLRTLLFNLYWNRPDCRSHVDRLFLACQNGKVQPPSKAQQDTLDLMFEEARDIYIVIDALDECNARIGMLSWLKRFQQGGPQLLVTSREEGDIKASFTDWGPLICTVPIQQRAVDNDIRAVVQCRLAEDAGFRRWRSTPKVRERIEDELMQKAGGMYGVVSCENPSIALTNPEIGFGGPRVN
jgi:hypothetical protein